MGALARGDVVLFSFPYTDLKNRKLRPCLVLSPEMGMDVLLCQITSRAGKTDEYTVDMAANAKNGLGIASRIRSNMRFTAEKTQIQRKTGRADSATYAKVTEKIRHLIETI